MPRIPQADAARRWRAETMEVNATLAALAAELDAERLAWTPPEGGWGVGAVLEHLCIANDSYLVRVRGIGALLESPDAPRAAPGETWAPSLIGGLLARSLESPRKLRAPRIYRPPPAARDGVLDAFLERQGELLASLDVAEALSWRRVRFGSPVTSLVRLNLGDAFSILVTHTRRHAGQIGRIRASPSFPGVRATGAERPR
jgi:hypothetical protein